MASLFTLADPIHQVVVSAQTAADAISQAGLDYPGWIAQPVVATSPNYATQAWVATLDGDRDFQLEATLSPDQPTTPTPLHQSRLGGQGVYVLPCGNDTGSWLETGWGMGDGREVMVACGCQLRIAQKSPHWRRGHSIQYICGQELVVTTPDLDLDRLWEADWEVS